MTTEKDIIITSKTDGQMSLDGKTSDNYALLAESDAKTPKTIPKRL